VSIAVFRPAPRRALGDKLQQLALLSPHDLKAIEVLVDFRLAQHLQGQLQLIHRASHPWPLKR
jgi:hypothetical protein